MARASGMGLHTLNRVPLCLAVVRQHIECHVHFWVPQDKTDIEEQKQVQRRVTRLVKSLKCKSYEERLRGQIVSLEGKEAEG